MAEAAVAVNAPDAAVAAPTPNTGTPAPGAAPPAKPSSATGAAPDAGATPAAAAGKTPDAGAAPGTGQDAGKEGDAGKAAPAAVPEKYELKLPEGALLDAAAVERTAAAARSLGLSQESAQKALEFANAEVAAFVQASNAQLSALAGVEVDPAGFAKALGDTKTPWVDQLKADKEIGGEALGKNAELARRVLAKFGTPQLSQALAATGYGNHPELVRMMVRIGKAMSEDSLVLGNRGGGAAPKDAASVLYGDSTKPEKE